MTILDEREILTEVAVKLRNADIYTTTQRGVTTVTEDFSGDDLETEFAVSNLTIKNVRSVLIGAAPQTEYSDYIVDLDTGVITFTTAPSTGVDNIHIEYDYGTDIIFPDYPKTTLNISSFPRVGMGFINTLSDDGGFGNVNRNTYNVSVIVYDSKKKDIRDTIKAIRTVIVNNIQGFNSLKVVKPKLTGPLAPSNGFEKFKDKIYQQNLDFSSRFNLEIN